MTIREFLATRRRKLMVLGFAAWLGFAASGVIAAQHRVTWLPFAFFVLFAAAVLGNLYWLKCPRCRGPLGITNLPLTERGAWFMRKMDFCPYCGVSLDETWNVPS
jgi:hypothetical protein